MPVLNGTLLPYTKYREHFAREQGRPVVWKWGELADRLKQSGHAERGTLTLSLSAAAGGCELLSGMAISTQVVEPGSETRPHAHSWWHLFFVQSGAGTAVLGDSLDATPLKRGDLLLVPGWCEHRFENLAGQEALILMSMTNLPQQAALSNMRALEPEDRAEALSR